MQTIFDYVSAVAVLIILIIAILWAFGVFGRLLLALEGRPLPDASPPRYELTAHDRELVANGWHPDDVIAGRLNGFEIPDKPPYATRSDAE